jgi:hypothetical protein
MVPDDCLDSKLIYSTFRSRDIGTTAISTIILQ